MEDGESDPDERSSPGTENGDDGGAEGSIAGDAVGRDGGEEDGIAEDRIADVPAVTLSPAEHQRVKELVHGEEMERIRGYDRRYLVAGAGGESGAARRRKLVYQRLDGRTDPPAVAMRLEDFDLASDEIKLWSRVFDVLCGRATHVVGVLEDFEGGYVWELGLLFAPDYRETVWILKRRYADEDTERERYENGMAASHLARLRADGRCHEWSDTDELRDAVGAVP